MVAQTEKCCSAQEMAGGAVLRHGTLGQHLLSDQELLVRLGIA